ncbi:serine/threonine-protein phosphatase 4 regulatory subunit 3-like isoform X2 [Argiope bruennichi]|uniref:serine/threonine-protein phosphatase 4 regulatory subunit 3-like isoform X2 n=1 Tax=Argiope bruennichi TaxID=94029 RepID=UPI0024948419|nr:serine/threonine-protein phosphatase 4 regulatory subunit 3-like isoform X2 [Argiope bruennichi]
MADTRRRVKLYALNADRQWDDRGTGHVSSSYIDRLKGMSLLVRAESDGSVLLESKILPDTAYQKQQETLIVWSEGDNFDLALSFQEKAGCDEIWEKICQVSSRSILNVQGKDPSVDITQDLVEESEDERFEDVSDSAPPIELPPCELSRLEELTEVISSCLPSPARREKLAIILESENYIKKLLKLFHVCEDLDNIEGLHQLYEIFRNIFMLNKNALFEVMFAEDTIFDVVGALEYDPSSPTPKRHRDFLRNVSHFKEVIPISNQELIAKIHQTYRVQYIQDVCFPTPSVFEENMLSTLSSFIFFNKVEIVSMIQDDPKYLSELFAQLTDESTDDQKRKELILFLKEYCMFSQTLQPQSRESFFKTLSTLGVLQALEITLSMSDPAIKSASTDILSYIVDFNPSMVREYALQQSNKLMEEMAPKKGNSRQGAWNQPPDDPNENISDHFLITVIIEQMISDTDPEMGGAVHLCGILKILLDPENMLANVNKSDFLNYFYKCCMHVLIAPVLAITAEDKPSKEDNQTAQLMGLILELLSFCVEHHTYHVKNYVMNRNLLSKILVLMKSKHTFLALCALRFMRKIIGMKDEFYNRYIISGNLFQPVVEAFKRNNGRYNLLDSAIVEMFEFIKVDIKTLCSHVVERYGKLLDKVDYVQTFKSLRLRYEQYLDRKDRSSVDNVSLIMRNSRYRRDPRQLEEDEEMWFNDDDEIEDEEPINENKDLDDEFDQIGLGKILDKRAREAEGKENVKNVPLRSFSPVMNNRRSNSPSSITPPASPTVEVKTPQLTRKGGLVDYPDEDSEEEDDDDEETNSTPPTKRLRVSS